MTSSIWQTRRKAGTQSLRSTGPRTYDSGVAGDASVSVLVNLIVSDFAVVDRVMASPGISNDTFDESLLRIVYVGANRVFRRRRLIGGQ
jgi:hypothetical protein